MIKSALEDSFERLVEEGTTAVKKTVKNSAKQVASTFSPTKMWEQLLGAGSAPSNLSDSKENNSKSSEANRGKNHTPLDLDKLNKKYQDTDKQKVDALRNRLFQLVKQGEEKVLYDKKKEEEEKKQKENYEAMEKKKKEEQKRQESAGSEIPKGKVRRSIFSAKKVAERSHAETKPATGKQ